MIGKIKDIGLWIIVYGHAPQQKTVEELFFFFVVIKRLSNLLPTL